MSSVARIFEDIGGYHICDDDGPLVTSTNPAKTKAEALRRAYANGYTKAIGSGTYWGNSVRMIGEHYSCEPCFTRTLKTNTTKDK